MFINYFKHIIMAIYAIFAICLVAPHAYADTVEDFQAIAKVIGFVENGPKGTVQMDILFDPKNPESVAHAEQIHDLTMQGVGDTIRLVGNKISAAEQATSQVMFITRGSHALYRDAMAKAAANHSITVSTNLDCLGKGCVLVVRTLPHVDILMSAAAAEQTGIRFSSAFSMLISRQ